MEGRDLEKAALRGEPSYVWRAGQQRRLQMILEAARERVFGKVLENGCGVGMYIEHLAPHCQTVFGLEFDLERAVQARRRAEHVVGGQGELLPFPNETFDLILSHEVLEHVQDDRAAVREMARVLRRGGRMVIFAPNRGYPFETHGIYWRGRYRFGNIPLVNYLPRNLPRPAGAPRARLFPPGPGAAVHRPAGALRGAHGDLRRLRQHHRSLAGAGAGSAGALALGGADSGARPGFIAFLGGGESLAGSYAANKSRESV